MADLISIIVPLAAAAEANTVADKMIAVNADARYYYKKQILEYLFSSIIFVNTEVMSLIFGKD
ncbi:hypothetical protein, partial [Pedobacter hartonius]|uniref:hypothetical protein n=1 Tax=Pedobacter hartonius TaxID=425514 RepID=UPI001C314E18